MSCMFTLPTVHNDDGGHRLLEEDSAPLFIGIGTVAGKLYRVTPGVQPLWNGIEGNGHALLACNP